MKPRIFIGSSSEGLSVAQRVKDYFSEDYDCYLWTDDVFKNNQSFLETLMKSASLFDFGFMIFSGDDILVSREAKFDSPRDNVLFEYGLFLGRVGLDRAYIISEKDAKVPTDMLGISHVIYEVEEDGSGKKTATESLEKSLASLKCEIDENLNLGHLGLLPSTAIAISYFEGFVKLVANWIVEQDPDIIIADRSYKEAKLKIVLPKTLDSDIKNMVSLYYRKHQLTEAEIYTKHRGYPVHFVASDNSDCLEIFDMPTILTGVKKAIEMYFRTGHVGKKAEQKLAEEMEINNFQRVLQLLIDEDAYCRECVEILNE